QALARMRRALDEYQVRGIETNLAFHRRCVRHAAFAAGDYDTGFIARNARELTPGADDAELTAAVIAAALDATHATHTATRAAPGAIAVNGAAAPSAPTHEISTWRRQLGLP